MAALTYLHDSAGQITGISTRIRTEPAEPEPEPDPDPAGQIQHSAEEERKEEA